MTHPTHPMNPIRPEKGVALVIVLLLLAVMAALTTGLALNGQTEIAMASNEVYYAGARAAAEAGMNRAIQKITAYNGDLLADGVVPDITNGPHALNDQYAYSFEILDDDDDALYPIPLTDTQRTQMGEQNPANPALDGNFYIMVRVTGTGPSNTIVRIVRVLEVTPGAGAPVPATPLLANPAILLNGNLEMIGNALITGEQGNVHANGNITGGGSVDVDGTLTATGTIADGLHGDVRTASGEPEVIVPEVKASDYAGLADWILKSNGTRVQVSTGRTCGTTPAPTVTCPSGWTWSTSGGVATWSASGSMPSSANYYVEGHVTVHGTGKSSMTQVSIIAEGNITLTGNGKFKPANNSNVQFVTNGDFIMGGSVDGDPDYDMDGQIMVREQIDIYGNTTFKGQVVAEDRDSTTNVYHAVDNPNGRRGSSEMTTSRLRGSMVVTYDGNAGTFDQLVLPPTATQTFTYNVSGWIEQ